MAAVKTEPKVDENDDENEDNLDVEEADIEPNSTDVGKKKKKKKKKKKAGIFSLVNVLGNNE